MEEFTISHTRSSQIILVVAVWYSSDHQSRRLMAQYAISTQWNGKLRQIERKIIKPMEPWEIIRK